MRPFVKRQANGIGDKDPTDFALYILTAVWALKNHSDMNEALVYKKL